MTTQETSVEAQTPPITSQGEQTVNDYLRGVAARLRRGDLGQIPVILGLLVIAVIFQSQAPAFLTAFNLTNLIVQMAGVATIAYGVVFVLLLGEIDLSISYVSAVAGVALALSMLPPLSLPWYVALPMALIITTAIGWLHGTIISFFQLPSFVVTLAGFLAWSGVVLIMIGGAGTVVIQDRTITGITRTFLSPELGWLVGIIAVVLFAATQLMRYNARRKSGLSTRPQAIIFAEIVLLAIGVALVIILCNSSRGVPLAGVILMIFLAVLTYLAENTKFGRYVYAIGGNKEAARRAGIRVERIRIIGFMLSSLFAGLGGVILAARLGSVATNAGGGDLLLNSIAAAVIGGTSLFGGRGKVWHAVLGAMVVMSIDNGLGLIPNVSAGARSIVTGLVLLTAVIIDAISRRGQQTT